jgi:hypothetical protein
VGEAKAFLGQKFSQLKAEAAQKLQQIEQALQEEAAKPQQVRRKLRHYGRSYALSENDVFGCCLSCMITCLQFAAHHSNHPCTSKLSLK